MRLDKLLSDLNYGSRKTIKPFLKEKRVQVNNVIITDGKFQVKPDEDKIVVDGEEIIYENFVYYLLHKPQGVITATKDLSHKTVIDLIDERDLRKDLFPVGRLDKDTEGLLLLTNDGQLAHQLLSPKKHVDKTYEALVSGIVKEAVIEKFAAGLTIDGGEVCLPAQLKIVAIDEEKATSQVEIVIQEGKYHQVKRMCHACGHEVLYLKRITMGGLKLPDDLSKGAYLKLSDETLKSIKKYS